MRAKPHHSSPLGSIKNILESDVREVVPVSSFSQGCECVLMKYADFKVWVN